MENLTKEKSNLIKAVFVFTIILSVYFSTKIFSEVKKNSMLGENTTPATISLSGHGEVYAVPDIANVYFTIKKESKTVKEAQNKVAEIEKKVLDFLKNKNVADKDIKTVNASFNPKYNYVRTPCLQVEASGVSKEASYDCGGSKQVLVGYEANESITVKIRNTDDVGSIMQGLGTTGVSDLSGPNFTIDDEDSLKAEARKKAIDNAREKAKALAKDLDVRLGRIANFSENGGYGGPIYYAKDAMMTEGIGTTPAPAEIPKGENMISSDVTITYEIK